MVLTNDERHDQIRAELERVQHWKDIAAAQHATSRYDQLMGREAALRWVLGIEDVTVIELRVDDFAGRKPASEPDRLAVLEAGFALYAAHVENLIERVYVLEQTRDSPELAALQDLRIAHPGEYEVQLAAHRDVSHPEGTFDAGDDPGWPHRSPTDAKDT